MPARPPIATVLFDEAHSEAWTIDLDLAREMQPAHPADSSLSAAASALSKADFEVRPHRDGPLTPETLATANVLVIAHPSDSKWEATTQNGTPRLSPDEIAAIVSYVEEGGGLIVLGETEHDKYENNLNELLATFGIQIENATIQDYEHHRQAPSWILAELDRPPKPVPGPDPLARVDAACFYRAGALAVENGARALARTHASASIPHAPLIALAHHGAGRVAVLADSDLFGDDCIADLDHEALWLNLVWWAGAHSFAAPSRPEQPSVTSDPDWLELRTAVSELRLRQEPDGSVDTSAEDTARLRELVDTIARAAERLKPGFPHQHEYIDAVASDLVAWADSGFAKPDFGRSTEAFRPDLWREDGIRHLVVFPMYKQNASRDVAFEALIVQVPWPDWVQELESTRYDNPKFVPVELNDYTDGYDSECAVLFPETFSYAEKPTEFHFGAIFCDREAERFRRVGSAAAEVLHLNLPPDAAALLSSPGLSRDAYILWDLVHDRTHMRGDLPFDPFMIRQRSPYWMYALEELRCDLTAFSEAVKLEREGFAFARHVQYAILFDRLFRFPITGSRVRNYDGLGGQFLFAFLHREGYAHWTDNRMTIDWNSVAEGVERLRERVQDLYHSGIDRSKLGQWTAAHDLISEYVPSAENSVWARDRRALPDVSEPKELVDLVRDDEFPLSLFYTQLGPKLAPALDRPRRDRTLAAA